MRIFLCRHGQTTGDIEDRYGGSYDDHLTDEGIKQSEDLAEKLKKSGIQKIYTSSLVRAKETSSIIGKKLEAEIEETPELKERNIYGVLSGMVKSEAREKFPDLVEAVKDFKNTIDMAESYEAAQERMLTGFKKVLRSKEKIVAVVTHGGTIKSIFRKLIGKEVSRIVDCGYAELEWNGRNLDLLRSDGIEMAPVQ
ncbi:MAG: phosphoglycerate mutase [Candidatus Woesebacteria bacterium GW2011_GWA1_41_13b]|uniref:Phosphoglycerate mutase n=1 Tax=Candidatus Woesebacteria bacterium GW2011_GWA1_41_13b TaxID=1618555 RepID=A0A0G0UUG4_9BACT|nr:MAG: phosphoglycerate mutase [Candidatus Woesebacteria bacterium GW2011_GWA1_41_13b]